MPVTCENSDSAISSTIRDSLGNYNGITKASNLGLTKNQLSAALKQSILKTIEYVDSPPGFGYSIQDSLKAKYTVLRPSDEEKATVQSVGGKNILLKFQNGNVNSNYTSFSASFVPFRYIYDLGNSKKRAKDEMMMVLCFR